MVLLIGTHHYVQLSEYDMRRSQVSPQDLKSVKAIVPTGAAVPSSCRDGLAKMFPLMAFILEGYGQTETGGVTGGFQDTPGLGQIVPWAVIKVKNDDPNDKLTTIRMICKFLYFCEKDCRSRDKKGV